jgi:hypothetical protein
LDDLTLEEETALTTPEPRNISEALKGPEADAWQKAVDEEIQGLMENGTWSEPVDLPQGRKALTTNWVFKRKMNADGTVDLSGQELSPAVSTRFRAWTTMGPSPQLSKDQHIGSYSVFRHSLEGLFAYPTSSRLS